MNQNEIGRISKDNSRRNVVKFAIVVFLLIVAGLIYNIGGCSKDETRSIYAAESNSNYQIKSYGDHILIVDYDGARLISETGEETASFDNHMSNPRAEICKEYILLYDKGGNTLSLYNGTKKSYSYEHDQPIKNAKVNKNGYVLLISDEVAYNSRISVLSPKGIEEYIWKIGDVYITDADISPDNRRITAAAISTDTGIIVENIIFVDINKEEETARIKGEGSLPLYVKYADTGNAVVVSDNRICGYKSNGDKKWENSYNNKLLKSFEVDDNGNTVLALSGIKNNTVIETYTKNGSKSGEHTTESVVKSIHIKDKYIAFCEHSGISVINYSGKLLDSAETKKEYFDVLITDRNKVILMSDEGIDLLSL